MWKRASMLLALAGIGLTVALVPLAAQEEVNDASEKAQKAAIAKVAPSVVQIETTGGTELIQAGPKGQQIRKGVGPTTGVIVATDGYVISSAFNFANKPSAIFVTVPGHQERYVAKVVATDTSRMLTLLKIEASNLVVPAAVPKKEMQIGQWALALGRTLEQPHDRKLEGPPSVSVGIISALNRIWGRAIQTDAKVSPVNYGGPLVDILGRVQGILVPASPREEGETAGVEWYDSGIGFAIPLEDVLAVLPRLKEGKDLRKGVLGVTMQGADQYEGRPTVATIQPNSAAQKAGIQTGDVIKAIDGKAIASQAQLLHQLGSKYEGEAITVTIERGGKEVQLEKVALGGLASSFPQPFLGILPVRDDPAAGEEVRFVYPQSPAEKAGIKAGDRITKIGVGKALQAFSGRDQLTGRLATLAPGTELSLELTRKDGGKTETVTAKLDTLPDKVPAKLSGTASAKKALEPRQGAKAEEKKDAKKGEKAETGYLKRRNAANDHDYFVYVPEDYDPNISYALVLWLHPVGKGRDKDFEDFAATWKDLCSTHHLIAVMPRAENENGWISSESDAVTQCVREVMGQYTIDRQRVVAHGMGIGGQMAFYLGFSARDLIRGVATTGAVLASPIKESVSNQRLQFFLVAGGKDPLAKDIKESADKLTAGKFSVVHREITDMGHQYLDAPTLEELARWLDSLDRQ